MNYIKNLKKFIGGMPRQNTESSDSQSGNYTSDDEYFPEGIPNYDTDDEQYFNDTSIRTAVDLWFRDREQAIKQYGVISTWNVGNVTNMVNLFRGKEDFNSDIGGWNVRAVTNMSFMFYNAKSFNQDIGRWNVGSVTNMRNMFYGAESFDKDIGQWNVGRVTNMQSMFSGAESFNQDLGSWERGSSTEGTLSNVTTMDSMFLDAYSFNNNGSMSIAGWDVGNVRSMDSMFLSARSFNQNISPWNVSNDCNLNNMFFGAVSFLQGVGNGVDARNPRNFFNTVSLNLNQQFDDEYEESIVKIRSEFKKFEEGDYIKFVPSSEQYKERFRKEFDNQSSIQIYGIYRKDDEEYVEQHHIEYINFTKGFEKGFGKSNKIKLVDELIENNNFYKMKKVDEFEYVNYLTTTYILMQRNEEKEIWNKRFNEAQKRPFYLYPNYNYIKFENENDKNQKIERKLIPIFSLLSWNAIYGGIYYSWPHSTKFRPEIKDEQGIDYGGPYKDFIENFSNSFIIDLDDIPNISEDKIIIRTLNGNNIREVIDKKIKNENETLNINNTIPKDSILLKNKFYNDIDQKGLLDLNKNIFPFIRKDGIVIINKEFKINGEYEDLVKYIGLLYSFDKVEDDIQLVQNSDSSYLHVVDLLGPTNNINNKLSSLYNPELKKNNSFLTNYYKDFENNKLGLLSYHFIGSALGRIPFNNLANRKIFDSSSDPNRENYGISVPGFNFDPYYYLLFKYEALSKIDFALNDDKYRGNLGEIVIPLFEKFIKLDLKNNDNMRKLNFKEKGESALEYLNKLGFDEFEFSKLNGHSYLPNMKFNKISSFKKYINEIFDYDDFELSDSYSYLKLFYKKNEEFTFNEDKLNKIKDGFFNKDEDGKFTISTEFFITFLSEIFTLDEPINQNGGYDYDEISQLEDKIIKLYLEGKKIEAFDIFKDLLNKYVNVYSLEDVNPSVSREIIQEQIKSRQNRINEITTDQQLRIRFTMNVFNKLIQKLPKEQPKETIEDLITNNFDIIKKFTEENYDECAMAYYFYKIHIEVHPQLTYLVNGFYSTFIALNNKHKRLNDKFLDMLREKFAENYNDLSDSSLYINENMIKQIWKEIYDNHLEFRGVFDNILNVLSLDQIKKSIIGKPASVDEFLENLKICHSFNGDIQDTDMEQFNWIRDNFTKVLKDELTILQSDNKENKKLKNKLTRGLIRFITGSSQLQIKKTNNTNSTQTNECISQEKIRIIMNKTEKGKIKSIFDAHTCFNYAYMNLNDKEYNNIFFVSHIDAYEARNGYTFGLTRAYDRSENGYIDFEGNPIPDYEDRITDLYGNMDAEDLKKTIRDKARELFLNENWIMANTSGFNQG